MLDQSLFKHIALRPDERVIRVVRKDPLVFLGPFAFGALFIIALFFFFYPLIRLRTVGMVIFLIALVFGVALIVRAVMLYSLNALVITNERIVDVDQQGFFRRTVSEIEYDKIEDMTIQIRGMFGTLFHYGTLVLQTGAPTVTIELSGIKYPERVQELIRELREERKSNQKTQQR